jgi:hypothetical protein
MKKICKLLIVIAIASLGVSCAKDGTSCRCTFKSEVAGRQEFEVDEETVLKVAKSCAGYESFLNDDLNSGIKYKCYNND